MRRFNAGTQPHKSESDPVRVNDGAERALELVSIGHMVRLLFSVRCVYVSEILILQHLLKIVFLYLRSLRPGDHIPNYFSNQRNESKSWSSSHGNGHCNWDKYGPLHIWSCI